MGILDADPASHGKNHKKTKYKDAPMVNIPLRFPSTDAWNKGIKKEGAEDPCDSERQPVLSSCISHRGNNKKNLV